MLQRHRFVRSTDRQVIPKSDYVAVEKSDFFISTRHSSARDYPSREVLTTLGAIFQKQVALRTIRFNPVSVAERMARGSNEIGSDDELNINSLEVRPEDVYSPGELARLIESAEPGFAQTILMVFAMTGARHGEGLALMWRDHNANEIIIRRNWS
jgi:integrase